MTRSSRTCLSSSLGAGDASGASIVGWACPDGTGCAWGALGVGDESFVAGRACANVAAAQIAKKKTHPQKRGVGHRGAREGMNVDGRMVRGIAKLRQPLYIGFRTGTDCCTVDDA